jgi:[protein-PII] uridylyltransferase
VLDLFRFNDPQGSFEPSKAEVLLAAVVAGRTDIIALLPGKSGGANPPSAAAPVVAFDNEASHRFTVLEIVAQDAPGLLYRISRALSTFRCEIEMVVIATKEGKAIDVFHVTRDGAKIADSDELQLTEILEAAAGSVA